ncbi:MAG: hypothetical protein ACI3X6_09200 [Alloprevotella sp.]
MKGKTFSFRVAFAALALCSAAFFCGCSDDDENNDNQNGGTSQTDNRNWSEDNGVKAADNLLFDGNVIGNGDQEFVFTGKQTLPKGTYTLRGWVYIANGAELTIEPGTVIRGDKKTKAALIVERGGKLWARGTANAPIVFTSAAEKGNRKPGDWGGVIICGQAPHNAGEAQIEGGPRTKHGGNNPADNSGALSYVRIEFAGYPFQTDKEINGLTLGSVGSGTQLDHIQVSYSNDDSFEWFGGTVNAKYLVAYKGWDDDFDTDNGFSGKVQYGLVVRDGHIADGSQSNGFESDNDASGSTAEPLTTATFSNITFIGPKYTEGFANNSTFINGGAYFPNNGSALGKFQSAMQIRRGSRLNCINSIAMGWPIGLIIDGEKGNTVDAAKAGNIKLQNIWFADMDVTGSDANKIYDDVLYDARNNQVLDANRQSYSSEFFLAQSGNKIASASEMLLGGTLVPGVGQGFMPLAGSPLLSAASFAGAPAGLDQVNFIGAFGTDNWLSGWTNFDPNNADY